ncbi:MAG: tyrosine-protein phosphatase [Clostridia bacterium]|nr:tyrosine-protein phosphatase [Clostridia bacterium]
MITDKKLNFRDIGCVKTLDGKTVKSGLILRSAKLSRLNEHDRAILEDYYKVSKVIDFRAAAEKIKKQDIIPDGARYIPIPFFNEANMAVTGGMGSDVFAAIKKAESKEELYNYIPDLKTVYPIVVTDDFALSQLSKAIKLIINNRKGAVLFHCTAGKDRTGIVSAIILKLLNVGTDEILRDYLLTNEVSAKNAEKYSKLARVFMRNSKIADKTYEVFLAKEEYIKSAYDAMAEKFGSFDNFVENGLGITREEIESFREYILE